MWNLEIQEGNKKPQIHTNVLLANEILAPHVQASGLHCLIARDRDESVLGVLTMGVSGMHPEFNSNGFTLEGHKGALWETGDNRTYVSMGQTAVHQKWNLTVVPE